MKLIKLVLFITFIGSVSFAKENKDCQRTARLGEKIIYIDTPDGKRGEGLLEVYKEGSRPYKLIKEYQDRFKIDKYSKATGFIATTGLLASTFYKGSKETRDNIVFGSAIVAGLNFLIRKTLNFINEQKLQDSINIYNKENSPTIEINAFNSKSLNSFAMIANWSF
jgi:hypothetical protein